MMYNNKPHYTISDVECPAKHTPKGICAAVIDDINNLVYFYGNISHENYHVPGGQAIPYVAVPSAGFQRAEYLEADEFFDGEQEDNNLVLAHTPIINNSFLVFLNGSKLREGKYHDYIVLGNTVQIQNHTLLSTDCVEVMYKYGEE